jgi:Lrp/AsnC family transcriptional regulator, regulator for asnA, asnC and gidA
MGCHANLLYAGTPIGMAIGFITRSNGLCTAAAVSAMKNMKDGRLDTLDALDLRLIRCLQDNPRAPYTTVARLTGVSETTVKRRIDDLIANNFIQPAMIANMYRLGYRTRAWLCLKVDLDRMMPIAQELSSLPETTGVTITSGRFNVTAFIVTRSLDSLTNFLAERVAPIEGIRDFEVMIVPRVLKVFNDWRVPDELVHEAEDITSEDGTLTNGFVSSATGGR